MITERIPGLADLSKEDKWRVIIELEDELIAHDPTLEEPLRSELVSLLESRLQDYHADSSSAVTLDAARAKLQDWKSRRQSAHE